jgi:glycosyltransferase involved in cell wall biosynthesis
MDYHPDFLVAEKKTPIKNLLCMLSNIAYLRALKRATQVVAIGECMQDKLIEKGLSADDITIIRNVSWSEADPEVDVNVIQDTIELGGEKIDISDRTVVLYSGNQGVAHEFRTILEAAVKLVHTHLFIFVGKGKRHADIVSAAQKLSNVYVMGYLDEQEFNRVKAFAHVHFISLREKYSGLMVPSKLYSSLHAGKVVLYEGSATSELAICLQNNKCGYTVPHGDIDAMTSALLRVHTEKDGVEFKEMGVRARNLYQAEYSYHRFGARYAQLLIPLL